MLSNAQIFVQNENVFSEKHISFLKTNHFLFVHLNFQYEPHCEFTTHLIDEIIVFLCIFIGTFTFLATKQNTVSFQGSRFYFLSFCRNIIKSFRIILKIS